MLFQSSKLKARTSLFTETWQKIELRAFENVTPSGIGCTKKIFFGTWQRQSRSEPNPNIKGKRSFVPRF